MIPPRGAILLLCLAAVPLAPRISHANPSKEQIEKQYRQAEEALRNRSSEDGFNLYSWHSGAWEKSFTPVPRGT